MLKIITLNTHKGFSALKKRFILPQLREVLRSSPADILFLQEVIGENIVKAKRYRDWPASSHYEFLADPIWGEYAYGKNAVYTKGHHGNAILSRYRILNAQKIDISTNRLEQRGILHCVIELPFHSLPLHCICVHLGLLGASRKKQARMIETYMAGNIERDAPVILAGDFNEWRNNGRWGFDISLGLKAVYAENGGRMAPTFPSFLPVFPLDRVYLRGLTPVDSKICNKGAWARLSDHAALFAEVKPDGTG